MKWHETISESVGIQLKKPLPSKYPYKNSAGHFFQGPLRCSWLCQIENKSLASLYTSSERTGNEMWEIRLCVCTFLCVFMEPLSHTFPAFLSLHLYCGRKWQKCFVFHWVRQIFCPTPSNEFSCESSSCTAAAFDRFSEWEYFRVVLTWRMCRWNAYSACIQCMVCKLPGSLT